jgi:hypothetical protein
MSWPTPSASDIWRAIDLYLARAYPGATPPAAVCARIDKLRALPQDQLLASELFERDVKDDPTKFSLRLGNKTYPHMKLVIERSPDGAGYLLRADTHDRHCCPAPESKEYAIFCQLMESNRAIADDVEHAWVDAGLPTFKEYLRQDLARRRSKSSLR